MDMKVNERHEQILSGINFNPDLAEKDLKELFGNSSSQKMSSFQLTFFQ
jgi:hypothetical protein